MISFIIVCYNNVEILRRCLTSYLWQSHCVEFEVILIDNNSEQENIDQVYREFYNDLSVTLVKQPKLKNPYSLCKARNMGLKLAKYPWVVTLDSDMVLNQHYLHSLADIIKNDPDTIIAGERIFVEFAKDKFPVKSDIATARSSFKIIASVSNYNLKKDRRMMGFKQLAIHPHPWAVMHGGNCIFKKSKALEINGFNEAYDGYWGYEDVDFAYRLITQTNCKPLYDKRLFCYHLENFNLTRDAQRFDKQSNPNWKKICDLIPGFKEFKEKEYESYAKNILL